jgi:hypothetical protein
MGEVIAANAAVSTIEEHVKKALENARAAGGEAATAAEARLASVMSEIAAAKATSEAAVQAEEAAWRQVASADDRADLVVGAVRDAMWNAVGRVRQHPAMTQVFPEGVRMYTAGDARQQPLLMTVLESRIAAANAPDAWPDAQRKAWAATIEAARAPLAAAVEAHRPTEAARSVAEAAYRAFVRTGRGQLVKLKRDLSNLGLTEKQIHAIIPDASPKGAGASKAAKKATEPTS